MSTRPVSDEQSARGPLPLLLAIAALTVAGCQARARAGDETARRFDAVRSQVCRGEYQAAVPKLEKFLADHPRHKDASRAGLFLGKAHLALGDLGAAKQAFSATVRDYPESLEAHKCRYKLAVVSLLEGNEAEARAAFGRLADKPDGPLAPEATAMRRMLAPAAQAEAPAGAP